MTRFRALAIINERCYHKLFLYPIPNLESENVWSASNISFRFSVWLPS